MNKDIMKQVGFEKEVKRVEQSKCALCKKEVFEGDFKDGLSLREYKISGMCQECQDKTFG